MIFLGATMLTGQTHSWGGWPRSGPEGWVGDQAQHSSAPGPGSRDRLVERREAQPLSPKGARVPRQASQTCLDRRAERALAKPVRGLASPWRLPALHFPFFRGRKEGNGVTRAAKSNNRVGQALAFCVARSAAAAIVPALTHTPPQVTTGLSMAATTRFDVLGIGNAIVDVIARTEDDF